MNGQGNLIVEKKESQEQANESEIHAPLLLGLPQNTKLTVILCMLKI